MKEIQRLKEHLEAQRPGGWEELPDLSLYMDQLTLLHAPAADPHRDGG